MVLKFCGPSKQDLHSTSTYCTDLHLSFIRYKCIIICMYATTQTNRKQLTQKSYIQEVALHPIYQ